MDEAPALAGLNSASVQGRIALGPRAGARVWRLGDEPEAPWVGAGGTENGRAINRAFMRPMLREGQYSSS